jgi:stage II sporulation SpoAA-like protein
MIEIIEGLPRNVVGIAVKGRVTMQDCRDVLMPAMERSLKRHDKIRLYYELGSRFPGAGWDDLDLGIDSASRCERVAIVTDIGWVRLTARALRFLIPGKIRVFATIEAEEGRAWITARPGSRADADVTETARMSLARPRMRQSQARSARTPATARRRRLPRESGPVASIQLNQAAPV